MKNRLQDIGKVLIFLFVFFLGIYIGRQTIKTEPEIKYVKEEIKKGNFSSVDLTPVKEEKPVNTILPTKPDTIWKDSIRYICQKVDTLAIINDYIMLRMYQKTLFDDKNGKMDITAQIQYNQLFGLNYEFTPITQINTVSKKVIWQPFITGGYSTNNSINLGAGTFYHNLGFEYRYNKSLSNNKEDFHSFNFKVKF